MRSYGPCRSAPVSSLAPFPVWPRFQSGSNFRFRCFCNGPLVVKLRVHPIAGFVLLSVVGVRPPLHAV